VSPVEYAGGKRSLRAYIVLCVSRHTATRLVLHSLMFAVLLPVLRRLLIMSINTIFSIFRDGSCLPSWVIKVGNFKYRTCSEGQHA